MKRAMFIRQAGLSLIELMIAIALSLLLILGVTQIFLSSKTTYASNQALSAIQESGRFAIEILSKDIRNTGYKGQCLTMPVNHMGGGSSSIWAQEDEPIHGWENSKPSFVEKSVVSSSDTLFIQFAEGALDVKGAANNVASGNTIDLSGGSSSIAAGEIVLISDGLACDVFENTANGPTALSKDTVGDWSHDYTDEFEILSFQSFAYYIAEDEGSGVPTLFRSRFSPDLANEEGEALVPGVKSMNIEYGIAANGAVNEYVAANAVTNWGDVASVKLSLQMQASSGLEKDFTTTVALRNRLP